MKILIQQGPPEMRHHRRGLISAFEQTGNVVLDWDPSRKPAFDAFDEWRPDAYCGFRSRYSRAVENCLAERPIPTVAIDDILPSADCINFSPNEGRKEWACDVAHIGPCTPEALKRAADLIGDGRNVKICGDDPSWPIPQYLGPIADESIPVFYASAAEVMTLLDPEVATQALLSGSRPLELTPPFTGTYGARVIELFRKWGWVVE